MKCKECKKRIAVVKMAVISIRYEKTAIEIVCDQVCMKCFKKSLSRPSSLFNRNPIESVIIGNERG